MIEYQYCPSCGFPIFYFQEKYNKERDNLLKVSTELPEYARVNTMHEKETGHIFDSLGVKNLCCRARLMTGTCFIKDVYATFSGKPNSEPETSDNIIDTKK